MYIVGKMHSVIYVEIKDYGVRKARSGHVGKEPVSHTHNFSFCRVRDEKPLKGFKGRRRA